MKSRAMLLCAAVWLGLTLLSGCSVSRVEWNKAAMQNVKTVALVEYTVPISVQYRDNPQETKQTGLQIIAAAANANNGAEAATEAQQGFLQQFNTNGLHFKVISLEAMQNNPKFAALAQSEIVKVAQAKAQVEKQRDSTAAGKFIGFLGSMDKATGDNPFKEGVGPHGFPAFGLAQNWSSAPTALQNSPVEQQYLKDAIAALGVDAAMVINDPGMSFTCQVCTGGGTGTGTTGGTFLVTIVDKTGTPILQMRQWFAQGDGTAAMAGYVVNPLQQKQLFLGHGQKTAQVFSSFYREKGGR